MWTPDFTVVSTPGQTIAFARHDGITSVAALGAASGDSADVHLTFISDDAAYERAHVSELIASGRYEYRDVDGNPVVGQNMAVHVPDAEPLVAFVGGGQNGPGIPLLWCAVNIRPAPRRYVHRFRVVAEPLRIDFSGAFALGPG